MNTFAGSSVSELYFQMLETALVEHDSNSLRESRVGLVTDLGQAYFKIDADGFRMPLLLKRGFNPIFAFTEFAWFIKGDNSLLPLQKVLPGYSKYSDDQVTLNGAYGYRLRKCFGFDQIARAIDILKSDPASRRVVLQLWSPSDLGLSSKDIPCNTQVMLKIIDGALNFTVINRSNDLFKGVPYNIFLFYMLQVFISRHVGCGVGKQSHFTDSLHVYDNDISKIKSIVASNVNVDFSKISAVVDGFSWNDYIDNQGLINFFSNMPYDCVNDQLFNDAHNIFYFNKNTIFDFDVFMKLSASPLAVASLLWHDSFGKVEPIDLFFKGIFMKKNRYYFEGFRCSEAVGLVEGASLFALSEYKRVGRINQMLSDNYIAEVSDEAVLLKCFFLSSVLATVDTQVLAPGQRENIVASFKSACELLTIDYNYLVQLIPLVESVWDH